MNLLCVLAVCVWGAAGLGVDGLVRVVQGTPSDFFNEVKQTAHDLLTWCALRALCPDDTCAPGAGGRGRRPCVARRLSRQERLTVAWHVVPGLVPHPHQCCSRPLNVRGACARPSCRRGELYLEFHRGTYTSHAVNKASNR